MDSKPIFVVYMPDIMHDTDFRKYKNVIDLVVKNQYNILYVNDPDNNRIHFEMYSPYTSDSNNVELFHVINKAIDDLKNEQ